MRYNSATELEEEKELEAKAFGTPEDGEAAKATTDAESLETATEDQPDTEAAPAKEEGLVTQKPEPVTDGQEDTKIVPGEDWEKRFKNLRNSRDQKLYETKRQLTGALQTISTLQMQVAELQKVQPKVDALEGVFTTEDVEALGESTVDALRRATSKATEAATASMEKQLQEQRELRKLDQKALAERTQQDAYDIFISRVESAVPDWEAINFEKGFELFLKAPDLDGTQRKAYFSQAEAQGNAALIIRYMREYRASQVVPKKADPLADKVTPTGEEGGAAKVDESNKENVSRSYIDKFYDDINRGRYKGRYTEQMKIEAMIDKATMEGRIDNNR